jgi:hypothetical protein
MRHCFLCAKEISIQRRNSVFCSIRCEQTYQALERRAPPLEGGRGESIAGETGEGRPRFRWPGEKEGEEKF